MPYTSSYQSIAKDIRNAGYEVLVFVTSEDEDLSRITCGNAILKPTTAQPVKLRTGPLVFTGERIERAYNVV